MSRRCETCRWWDEDGAQFANATREVAPQRNVGTCEVEPPKSVVLPNGVIVSVFPTTHASRVCGRWASLIGGPDDGERADTTVIQLRSAA
jgi:hypothetical protein